jgi:adenylate cyclase class IV
MDERTLFERQNGTVKLNRELKGLCGNLEEVAEVLKRIGALPQSMEVNQTDYVFRLPSLLSGRDTRRIKFRLVNGEPFGVYLYDRFLEGTKATFEYIRPSDLTLVQALQSSDVPYVLISKTRTRWILGDILIHLDRVQGLGDVVEVETLSEDSIPNEVIEVITPYLFKKLEGSNEDYMQLNDQRREKTYEEGR